MRKRISAAKVIAFAVVIVLGLIVLGVFDRPWNDRKRIGVAILPILAFLIARRCTTTRSLLERLRDGDPVVRRRAAEMLDMSRLRTRACTANVVTALVGALHDESSEVRRAAALSLAGIGPRAEEAVSALVESLADADSSVRGTVAYALGEVRPDSRDAVPALCRALQDGDAAVRLEALWALGRFRETAGEAIPLILEAVSGPDHRVSRAAQGALKRIAPNTQYGSTR